MNDSARKYSDSAVIKATGRSWAGWFELLDARGAARLDHKGIVALLAEEIGSMWWRQTVAVEYEKARGLRVTGETADGSYQIGAQKAVALAPDAAWKLIVSKRGLAAWLGGGGEAAPAKGVSFNTDEGISGEYRVVREGSHLRLSWLPPGWKKPSTLQVRVTPGAGGRSVISFHHEGLPDGEARSEMKRRWQAALAALGAMA